MASQAKVEHAPTAEKLLEKQRDELKRKLQSQGLTLYDLKKETCHGVAEWNLKLGVFGCTGKVISLSGSKAVSPSSEQKPIEHPGVQPGGGPRYRYLGLRSYIFLNTRLERAIFPELASKPV